jgi:hypothetical protein
VNAADEILSELERRGVTVRVDGEMIRLRPKSALDNELLNRVRAHKPEIIRVLSVRLTTCAASCYEVEPGRWIHHPWDGCKTPFLPRAANPVPQSECRHCEGKGECDCPACTLRRTNEPTPCSMCRWEDHRLWVAASRPEACWHCDGTGKCECIACNSKEPCRTCGGSGKAAGWIQ